MYKGTTYTFLDYTFYKKVNFVLDKDIVQNV